jgi:hypothetical protein
MDTESLREEYRKKVDLAIPLLSNKLTDSYPAEIYMLDPDSCADYELIDQCLRRPKLYCLIDKRHTEADAIPIQRILPWYSLEHIAEDELDENYLKVYEGSYSQPPTVCLWSVLKQHRIVSKTAERFSNAGLRTSPHAIKIIVQSIAKPENALRAETIIDECVRSSLDKYF